MQRLLFLPKLTPDDRFTTLTNEKIDLDARATPLGRKSFEAEFDKKITFNVLSVQLSAPRIKKSLKPSHGLGKKVVRLSALVV
jgi:hypothetical protein